MTIFTYRAAALRHSTPILSVRCMPHAAMMEVAQSPLQPRLDYLGFSRFTCRCVRLHADSRSHLSCLFGLQDQEFGPHKIHASEIFARTSLSFAFVNLKPVVPGMSNNVMGCPNLRRCRSKISMQTFPKLHMYLHGS